MATFRSPSEEEFRDALKYGISNDRISDPSKADPQKSFVGAGSITIRDSEEKYLFSINLNTLNKQKNKEKRKQGEKNEKIGKIAGCLFVPLVLFGGCSILVAITNDYTENQKKKQESFLASLDYNRPVKVYKFTNEIWEERSANKLVFDDNRQGKMVHVYGRIPKSCIQESYVCIEGARFDILPPRIDCNIREKEVLNKLRAGMTIKVAGLMNFDEGFLDDVKIDYCKVYTNVKQRGANMGEAYSDTYDQFNQLLGE